MTNNLLDDHDEWLAERERRLARAERREIRWLVAWCVLAAIGVVIAFTACAPEPDAETPTNTELFERVSELWGNHSGAGGMPTGGFSPELDVVCTDTPNGVKCLWPHGGGSPRSMSWPETRKTRRDSLIGRETR